MPSIIKQVTTRAPGKIILTGEHAVTQGAPGIAFAVDRYLTTTVSPHDSAEVVFELVDIKHNDSHSLEGLHQKMTRIQNSFRQFQKGRVNIREVIRHPFELVEYTVACLIDRFDPDLKQGFHIRLNSDLPISSGMGSSAASIVSVTCALSAYFNHPLPDAERQVFHLNTESLQHGRSSGIDTYLSHYGGMHYFTAKQQHPRPVRDIPLWAINTGKPIVTTGECVSQALQYFKANPGILKLFEQTTNHIDKAWQAHDMAALKRGVNDNHHLLCEIGVVPRSVQKIIAQVRAQGLAAKVSGAGAIRGDHAGLVLVVGGKPQGIAAEQIHIVERGVERIDD